MTVNHVQDDVMKSQSETRWRNEQKIVRSSMDSYTHIASMDEEMKNNQSGNR